MIDISKNERTVKALSRIILSLNYKPTGVANGKGMMSPYQDSGIFFVRLALVGYSYLT